MVDFIFKNKNFIKRFFFQNLIIFIVIYFFFNFGENWYEW